MSPLKPNFPDIPEAEHTPVIDALLELLKWQSDRIEQLEDEIQRLKQETRKPTFESTKMDENTEPEEKNADNKQKKGPKRNMTQDLEIHEEQILEPDFLTAGARFKGYRDIIVQDLIIRAHNIRYRLAEYETSEGYLVATLPAGIRNLHWGSTLHVIIQSP